MTAHEAAAPGGAPGPARPRSIDVSRANHARVYDYLLGGKDNYAADRAAAEAVLQIWPDLAFSAQANRAFLGRMVRFLAAEAGVRQFLDIGTGIPTAGNTHEIAQSVAPETRVAYVDYDPIVLAHARALLTSNEAGATEYIDADLRDTATILERAGELLDFSRPVALTLVAILHAIPDEDDPHAIVARLVDAMPSGSYLGLTHLGAEFFDLKTRREGEDIADRMSQQQYIPRSLEQVARFFESTDLVEPGIVRLEQWRPEPGTTNTSRSSLWCAVGRKR